MTPTLTDVERALRPLVLAELSRRRMSLDDDDLEDLVQELLISAWSRDLPRFDARRGTLMAFLRRRVSWSLLDLVRRLKRTRTQSIDDLIDDAHEPAADGHDPDALLDAVTRERCLASLEHDVAEAMDALDDERALFALIEHDVRGRPLRDVARDLDVHPANATRARQRAITALRARLDEVRPAA